MTIVAAVGLVEPGEHLQQRRLAGAVRAAQADALAVVDLPGDRSRAARDRRTTCVRVERVESTRTTLFAERFGGGGEDARHAEGLGEIARHAEVDRLDRAGLGREAGDDDDREVGLEPARLADDREPVDARHLQVGDEQVVGDDAQPLERGAAVGREVDVVLGQRQRLRQQIADRRFVVDDEHARPAAGGAAAGARRRRRAARPPRGRWLSSQASMSRLRNRHCRPTRTAGILPALIRR